MRLKIKGLNAFINARIEKSEKTHQEIVEKKQTRRRRKKEAIVEMAELPDPPAPVKSKPVFSVGEFTGKGGQNDKPVLNWYSVQCWFRDGIERNMPESLPLLGEKGLKQTWWTEKDKACAQRLLNHFGDEVSKKAVDYICDNWSQITSRSNGRISGIPGIGLLWAMRNWLVADAVKVGKKGAKKSHLSGDYDAESAAKSPDFGWGSV